MRPIDLRPNRWSSNVSRPNGRRPNGWRPNVSRPNGMRPIGWRPNVSRRNGGVQIAGSKRLRPNIRRPNVSRRNGVVERAAAKRRRPNVLLRAIMPSYARHHKVNSFKTLLKYFYFLNKEWIKKNNYLDWCTRTIFKIVLWHHTISIVVYVQHYDITLKDNSIVRKLFVL